MLLTVPADVEEGDVEVCQSDMSCGACSNSEQITLERDYIVAGIRGHDPVVKVSQAISFAAVT